MGALLTVVVLALLAAALWEPARQQLLKRGLRGAQCLLVLPRDAEENGDSLALLQEGLAGAVTERLTRLEALRPQLRVVSTSERRKEEVFSPRQARERCGATLVLLLHLYREGERRQLGLSLVRTRTLETVFADAVPLSGDDYMEFQNGTEQVVARWLGIDLSRRPPNTAPGVSNAPIAQLYLEGLGALARFDKAENREKAITCFRETTKTAPGFALGFARLGEALAREFDVTRLESRLDEARAACASALRIDPRLSDAHYALGLITRSAGQREEAIRSFARACELDEFHHDAMREWAHTLTMMGQMDQAERRYLEAIRRNPSYWAGYNQLGVFYVRKGAYAKAEQAFRTVIDLAPDSYMGYRNLGGLLHIQGRYEEAVGFCEQSIRLKPNAEAYSNLGTIEFFHRRQYARAAGLFDRAADLQPGDFTLWGNLGDACRQVPARSNDVARAYANAIRLASDELKRVPDQAEITANLATYHSGLGDHTQAMALAGQALARDPASKDVQFLAALVFERAGQRARALKAIDRAAELEYSPVEITNHPDLAGLRGDPAFSPIAARLGAVNPTGRSK